MFKIITLDGQQKIPDDGVCYILAKSGTYIKKKLGLIESLTPVKEISILEDVKPYAKLSIPKIPGKDFAKIMKFFKDVYEEYRSEAIVLLYYNMKNKSYKIYVPHQKVNGASLDYTKGVSIKDYIQIGTIHSHANFSAFHSGVDDSDEEHFDGLHITIGDNSDEFPSISASVVVNGTRFKICPTEYVENLDIVEYTKYFPQMFRPSFIEINGVKEYTKDVKSNLGYKLNIVLSEDEVEKEWMEMIEDNRPAIAAYTLEDYAGENWYDRFLGKNQDDNQYVSSYHTKVYGGETKKEKSKYNPCKTCVFKKYKLDEIENRSIISKVKDKYKNTFGRKDIF